jgi:serpin B
MTNQPVLILLALVNVFSGSWIMDVHAGDPALAAHSINALGLDLMAKGTAADANALLSPYSIQMALAMTYAGAAGLTRAEMAKALHYTDPESNLHDSFSVLRVALDELASRTAERAKQSTTPGGYSEPVVLVTANRLFGQQGYRFQAPFLSLAADKYHAPFQPMDFMGNPTAAVTEINSWVEQQTRARIVNLVPREAVDESTRLVLVNAVYFKAPWAREFLAAATKPALFHLANGQSRRVPTMVRRDQFGYHQHEKLTAVSIPYAGRDLRLLVLLPDEVGGLASLESRLTPKMLTEFSRLPQADLVLHLPRFKLAPPLLKLGHTLRKLGMNSAFDEPPRSANFERIAPRKSDEYLYLSEVLHKTFLDLDERGTEAAAATAVMMPPKSAATPRPKPVEVKVDRPFFFAIQHSSSGACLFIGRVTDPR